MESKKKEKKVTNIIFTLSAEFTNLPECNCVKNNLDTLNYMFN